MHRTSNLQFGAAHDVAKTVGIGVKRRSLVHDTAAHPQLLEGGARLAGTIFSGHVAR